MTTPRRRLLRTAPPPAASRPHADRRLQKLRTRLEAEQATLARWFVRLKRAFHIVERCMIRIRRIERQIARQEE